MVHLSARLGKDVSIAERMILSEGVKVGDRSQVGANSVVGANVAMGKQCTIYPNVTIYPGVQIGDRVIIHSGVVLGSDGFGYVRDKETGRYHKFPQVGRLVIEDDVEIGANRPSTKGHWRRPASGEDRRSTIWCISATTYELGKTWW